MFKKQQTPNKFTYAHPKTEVFARLCCYSSKTKEIGMYKPAMLVEEMRAINSSQSHQALSESCQISDSSRRKMFCLTNFIVCLHREI